MRDRLIELLYEAEGQVNNDIPSVERIADYLLANGVNVQSEGKWGFKGTAYGCSLCGFGVIAPIYNFCPNCGAYMKGGAE